MLKVQRSVEQHPHVEDAQCVGLASLCLLPSVLHHFPYLPVVPVMAMRAGDVSRQGIHIWQQQGSGVSFVVAPREEADMCVLFVLG